jgi:hypothetical protein
MLTNRGWNKTSVWGLHEIKQRSSQSHAFTCNNMLEQFCAWTSHATVMKIRINATSVVPRFHIHITWHHLVPLHDLTRIYSWHLKQESGLNEWMLWMSRDSLKPVLILGLSCVILTAKCTWKLSTHEHNDITIFWSVHAWYSSNHGNSNHKNVKTCKMKGIIHT